MAGLLAKDVPMPPDRPATDGAAPSSPDAGQGDAVGAQPNVTPEEQQQYEAFVMNCVNLVSDPKVLPTIRDMLKHDPDPIEALARTASMLVIRVEDDAEQKGAPVDGDIVFHAGAAVVSDLSEVAERLGIHKYTQDQVNAAFLRAVDMYRAVRMKQGKLDQGEFAAEFDQIKKLDQTGQLASAMPGLQQFAKDNAHDAAQGDVPPMQQKGMGEHAGEKQ